MQTIRSHVCCSCIITLLIFLRFRSFLLNWWPNHKIGKRDHYDTYLQPVDSPLVLFWDCKNSPSLYEMDHKCPCVLAWELFDVNGLVCVEIDRLRHGLKC